MREIQRIIILFNLQRSHWIKEQAGQLTGLSETGQLLADSFRIDGSHTDGVLRVRGQLGKQDVGFPPTDLGLIMGKEKKPCGWLLYCSSIVIWAGSVFLLFSLEPNITKATTAPALKTSLQQRCHLINEGKKKLE